MASPIPAVPSLGDALVILGAAGIVIPVFARFRITPVIGFILVGLTVGPSGLGAMVGHLPWLSAVTITDGARLQPFARFGIVLLLFSVGLELSFDRLWAMRAQVFGLGALELIITAALLTPALMLAGQHVKGAVGVAAALAMSSTALVLPIVGTRTAVGRASLAMLLFEDMALVPIIFLIGAFSPHAGGGGWGAMARTLWLGALVVALLLVVGRVVLPVLFAQAARTKSPELVLSASLLVVIVSALATSAVGLSGIVGALIAGLTIAETQYHGEVEVMTAPFKGLALGVFLITIGMSLDLGVIVRHLIAILAATAGVLVLKAAVTGVLLRLMGARPGTATEAGILLAAPSESTLIVLTTSAGAALIGAHTEHFWQIVTALGMTVTPLLASLGRRLARRLEHGRVAAPGEEHDGPDAVIVGFGRVGRLVGDMLRRHGKSFVAIDSNPDVAAEALAAGWPVRYGNAASGVAMARLGVERARAVILTMDEPVAAQQLVRRLRRTYPHLPIIARARDAADAAMLYRCGASHAVPDALEASLQLSEAVLVDLGVAMGPVIASIHEKRDELRALIMAEGELANAPRLRSLTRGDHAEWSAEL